MDIKMEKWTDKPEFIEPPAKAGSNITSMMSTAYKCFRKEFQNMFINIRHNCAFQEN